MLRVLAAPAVVALFLATMPAQAQYTQRWSDNLVLPGPKAAPSGPAPSRPPANDPGYTKQWSTPSYTRQRSDAENQAIVDQMTERARKDAREGRGAGLNQYQSGGAASVPNKLWKDHLARDRANEEFRRREDDHYARQRYHNGN